MTSKASQPAGGWALPLQACARTQMEMRSILLFCTRRFRRSLRKCIRDLDKLRQVIYVDEWLFLMISQSTPGTVSSCEKSVFSFLVRPISVGFINPCLFAGWWRGWGGFWPTLGGCGGAEGNTVMSCPKDFYQVNFMIQVALLLVWIGWS